MHQLSAKLSHFSIAVFVLFVSLNMDVESAPAVTPSINRPEAQLSVQEMEKFLEGLTRYLHRQRLEQQRMHQQKSPVSEEGTYDPDAIDRAILGEMAAPLDAERSPSSELANSSMSHARPPIATNNKWPWSLSNFERNDDQDVKQRQPYGKRNSELINSLLGLPRFMKVVG
ncbi:pigment dispersing hormone precursor [Daphnia sinensis]|uniref:Pigment dispersing hormone n=1 Tax=Daphnia sinensis TaxID=1820382 RepID=A0AAD5PYJ6_9CRUS|nr:pigment dispersing hormone precursor [Daphnia sinensis]